MSTLILRSLLLLCVPVLSLGCGDDSGDSPPPVDSGTPPTDSGGSDATAPDTGTPPVVLPSIEDLEVGQWHELIPGGETVCSRGTEFAFYVYRGSSPDLAVNFVGGGACWNDLTCSFAGSTFSETIDGVRAAFNAGTTPGIANMDDARNPIMGYTHVVVPYCTGDVHWGNKETDYGGGITIQHRGAVNAQTVLDWVYANVTAPEKVLTTGCSAGGYGSILWSAYLMEQYPTARHVQFSDSAAGIITDTFFMDSFPSWNATEAFPDIPGYDPATVSDISTIYTAFAEEYPESVFSQYNTIVDGTQVFFYEAMGGAGGATGWSAAMLESDTRMQAADNFRSWTADGDRHCIIVSDDFFTLETDGTNLSAWVGDMLEGTDVADVRCPTCGG